MGFIQKTVRNSINFFDFLLFQVWLFRFRIGYKMWGNDYRIRGVQKAPARYLKTILKRLGADIDDSVTLKAGLLLDNLDLDLCQLHIGDKAYIGPGVFMDLAEPITIGPEVVVAPQVMLLTHGDVGDRMLAKIIPRKAGPVFLKEGCWIGARAVILPGITIGKQAVVGAGAVVTADVPDFSMVAGVPAREIRQLT
jgi:acetyltransferase-like isoleucine patch superfamily enzyme